MGLSEALSEGLGVIVIGLIIVFSVLLILMLVLMLMKVVFYKEPKPEKTEALPNTAAPAVQKAETAADSSIDEGELIAVLAAAVAASLNTSTYNLNIKSFRRIKDNSPSWNKAGRTDVINSRF